MSAFIAHKPVILSKKHRFIYLANSKTGTTSVESHFGKYNECKHTKHATLDVLNFNYSDYFIFCFVRNPWDRILSAYMQTQKPNNLKNPYRKHIYELSRNHSFSNFLKIVDNRFWKDYDQSKYYLNNGNLINFVGRFENLSSDLRKACDKLNIEYKKFPHNNKSQHKHYTEHYNDETIQIVAEKSARDIEYFGYKYAS
jgi:hypothetical protein